MASRLCHAMPEHRISIPRHARAWHGHSTSMHRHSWGMHNTPPYTANTRLLHSCNLTRGVIRASCEGNRSTVVRRVARGSNWHHVSRELLGSLVSEGHQTQQVMQAIPQRRVLAADCSAERAAKPPTNTEILPCVGSELGPSRPYPFRKPPGTPGRGVCGLGSAPAWRQATPQSAKRKRIGVEKHSI